MFGLPDLAFDPLLPMGWIWTLGILCVLAIIVSRSAGLKSLIGRLGCVSIAVLALLNPQTVTEERTPLDDIVLVLTDRSESTQIGTRGDSFTAHKNALVSALETQDNLEIIQVDIPPSSDGTRLATTLLEAVSDIPPARFAGVVALSDGQIHDLPDNPEDLLPDGVPFHSLIVGDPSIRDRRIRAIRAPKYGLVDELAEFDVQIDDPGHEGEEAWIDIHLNGDLQARFPVTIGHQVSVPVRIERRGTNTVELRVDAAADELTLVNNSFISEFSGIRDRLQVLLVTGNPHIGGRAWRNLLKSDPSVDLVQFTILTNPTVKNPNASQRELSLIAFPTRQLFEEKLDNFDLIIFDQFQRRFRPGRTGRSTPLLQPYYLQNIANYVENGGALLVATGPYFAGEDSLYRSPLAAVLPARPTGDLLETAFTPELSDKGRRHPITAGFAGREDTRWGPWYRLIENHILSGHVLMEGPSAEPLLVIEKVGNGRVAMLMSDQAWLWAKDYKGGGPYSEMFRRLAHWLMGEPDLEAERLGGRIENGMLSIERRSLDETSQAVTVISPDGQTQSVTLEPQASGVHVAQIPINGQGAYRLTQGHLSTIAAAGALNPKEFADLRPTDKILGPFSQNTGGGIFTLETENTALPDIRRPNSGQNHSDTNLMGLIRHDAYVTTTSKREPLLPGWLFFGLIFILLGVSWWRESR